MQNQPQSGELHPMQDADAECRMQNRAQSCELQPDAGCRMQNAECRIGPKATDALHPMQNAGCGHPTDKLFGSDFASCILNQFWVRFCILHPAFCMLHIQTLNIFGWVLGSAFCICILHIQRNTECRISPSVQRLIHCRLQPACYKSACNGAESASQHTRDTPLARRLMKRRLEPYPSRKV